VPLAPIGPRWPRAFNDPDQPGHTHTQRRPDAQYVFMATAAIGRAYKYVYEADQVPSLPPLPGFEPLPGSIWITNKEGVILQVSARQQGSVQQGSMQQEQRRCHSWLATEPPRSGASMAAATPQSEPHDLGRPHLL
jgi:hypothetical protein